MPKDWPLLTTKKMMDVNQRDTVVQMESHEFILLYSEGPNYSRRNRPALPPEEESSSHRDCPG